MVILVFCLALFSACLNNLTINLSNDQKNLTIEIGEGIKLTPILSKDTTIVFSSSNQSIVTVNDDGLVLGVSKGSAIVSVTILANGAKVNANIIVVEKESDKLIGIEIIGENNLIVGESTTLSVLKNPVNANGEIIWSSSNEIVAVVDEGVVSALSAGLVIISASSGNIADSIIINVDYPILEDIILSCDSNIVWIGEEIIFNLNLVPTYAIGEFNWFSSNEGIIKVENGVGSALSSGEVIISVQTINNPNIKKEIKLIVVDDIQILGEELIVVGDECEFNLNYNISEDILWSVSDENIGDFVSNKLTVFSSGVVVVYASFFGHKLEFIVNTFDFEIIGSKLLVVGSIYEYKVLNIDDDLTWEFDEEYFEVKTKQSKLELLALRSGLSIISVSYKNINTFIEVSISSPNPISIDIIGDNSIFVGDSITYNVNVYPIYAINEVNWSIISGVGNATIDEYGKLTALKEGIVIIKASYLDVVFGTLEIDIKALCPTSIEIIGPNSVYVNQQFNYTIEVFPLYASTKVVWSVDSSIANINSDGLFIGNEVGVVTISATIDCVVKTKVINIIYEDLVGISINGDSSLILNESLLLSVTTFPVNASKEVNWSVSDTSIATINNDGVLTALKVGVVTVYASKGGISQSKLISIVYAPVSLIVISGSNSVYLGSSITFAASVYPANASQDVNFYITDHTKGSINSTSGVFTPLALGEVVIYAFVGSFVVEKVISIIYPPATDIMINGPSEVNLGSTTNYFAIVYPQFASQDVIWSVDNNSIANIDSKGSLTSLKAGEVNVIAKQGNVEYIFKVTIIYLNSESIEIEGDTNIRLGSVYQYNAIVLPLYSNPNVTWSVSNDTIATIDANGLLTPISVGNIIVYASFEAIQTMYNVSIDYNLTSSITINGPDVIHASESENYTVNILPLNASQSVSWSIINNDIASIDSSGLVKTTGVGVVIISAIQGSIVVNKTINILPPLANDITINGTSNMIVNDTSNFSAIVYPLLASQLVTWSVSNTNIANIDNDGVLIALDQGVVIVYCSSGVIIKSFEVTISYELASSIEIIGETSVVLGNEYKYFATVKPTNANQKVMWSVDDEDIGTIDENGTLTLFKVGNIKIFATMDSITAQLDLTITRPLATSIKIDGPSVIEVDVLYVYYATIITPVEASNTVSWSVSNTSIAQISVFDDEGQLVGMLVPKSVGDIFLTASVDGVMDTIFVRIVKPTPTDIEIVGPNILDYEEEYLYSAVILPNEYTYDIFWSVSDTSKASIDQNGNITIIGVGSVTIFVELIDYNLSVAKTINIVSPLPNSIEIQGSETLSLGSHTSYVAQVTPSFSNNSVIWSVSNTDIASIDTNGVLTSISVGVVTIYATSSVNSLIVGSKIVEVILDVIDLSIIAVSDMYTTTGNKVYITLNSKSIELIVGYNAFNSLTSAIASAEDNSKIYLVSGSYSNVNITKDGISLIGYGSSVTITGVISISANNVSISDLRFTNLGRIHSSGTKPIENLYISNNTFMSISGSSSYPGVINILGCIGSYNKNIYVTNNHIESPSSDPYNCIRINGVENVYIVDNVLIGGFNTIAFYSDANTVDLSNSVTGRMVISNNTIKNFVQIGIRVSTISSFALIDICDNYFESTETIARGASYVGPIDFVKLNSGAVANINVTRNVFYETFGWVDVRFRIDAAVSGLNAVVSYNTFISNLYLSSGGLSTQSRIMKMGTGGNVYAHHNYFGLGPSNSYTVETTRLANTNVSLSDTYNSIGTAIKYTSDVLIDLDFYNSANPTIVHKGKLYIKNMNLFNTLNDNYSSTLSGLTYIINENFNNNLTILTDNTTLTSWNMSSIGGILTLNANLKNLTIEYLTFIDNARILNTAGSAGTSTNPAVNINGFNFNNNFVNVNNNLEFIKFTENASSYSWNISITNNLFNNKGSGNSAIVYLDNLHNLTITNNTFKNITGSCIYVHDTTKGLTGDLIVLNNIFENVSGNALAFNWFSPLPGTTDKYVVKYNLFKNINGIGLFFGNTNLTDVFDLSIIGNTFDTTTYALIFGRVVNTAKYLVKYNVFKNSSINHIASGITLNLATSSYASNSGVDAKYNYFDDVSSTKFRALASSTMPVITNNITSEIEVYIYKDLLLVNMFTIEEINVLELDQNKQIIIHSEFILDEMSIAYSSSNSVVISVEPNGLLKANSYGSSFITITIAYMSLTVEIKVLDVSGPIAFITSAHINNVMGRNISTYGSTTRVEKTYGSVSMLWFDSYTIDQRIIPISLGRPGTKLSSLQFITIHDTGNNSVGSSALANSNYLHNVTGTTYVSWHFVIDKNTIIQNVPLDEVAYHAGDGSSTYNLINTNVKAPVDYVPYRSREHLTYQSSQQIITIIDGYFAFNGVKSTVAAPKTDTGATVTTSQITPSGIYYEVGANGNYYINATHWSGSGYNLLANNGGNRNSIGIETCIDANSDLTLTWHRTAKLVANLLKTNNLAVNRVMQHNGFSGKNCPQVLRRSNLWENTFMKYIEFEHSLITKYSDYNFTFVSNNPTILSNAGIIVNRPAITTVVSYTIHISGPNGYNQSVTLYSSVPGSNTF